MDLAFIVAASFVFGLSPPGSSGKELFISFVAMCVGIVTRIFLEHK